MLSTVKGKAICIQAWRGPEGSQKLRIPEFLDHQHMKVTRLSSQNTGYITPQGTILIPLSVRLGGSQGHSVVRIIESLKNSPHWKSKPKAF
jgi:hypothetical protein